ncbi:hypothetical protein CALCODRAFT_505484 [Calocera cornea HHB12733]|uniref:Uncharacterized protein n=1 Tax=Calocera cornea HHB12733 TaxID=1353952 RepID=A0A165K671_9BASI|nr:hypothetical protein CALCODRAFT_505484 [Calocera cornea HHB12733]
MFIDLQIAFQIVDERLQGDTSAGEGVFMRYEGLIVLGGLVNDLVRVRRDRNSRMKKGDRLQEQDEVWMIGKKVMATTDRIISSVTAEDGLATRTEQERKWIDALLYLGSTYEDQYQDVFRVLLKHAGWVEPTTADVLNMVTNLVGDLNARAIHGDRTGVGEAFLYVGRRLHFAAVLLSSRSQDTDAYAYIFDHDGHDEDASYRPNTSMVSSLRSAGPVADLRGVYIADRPLRRAGGSAAPNGPSHAVEMRARRETVTHRGATEEYINIGTAGVDAPNESGMTAAEERSSERSPTTRSSESSRRTSSSYPESHPVIDRALQTPPTRDDEGAESEDVVGLASQSTSTSFGTLWILVHERGAAEVEVVLRPRVDLANFPLDPPAGIFIPHVFKATSRMSTGHAHPLERFVSERYGAYMVATATLPIVSCEGENTAYYSAAGTGYRILGSFADLIEPDGPAVNTPISRARTRQPTYKDFLSRVEPEIGQTIEHITDRAYILYLIDCYRASDIGPRISPSLSTAETMPAGAFVGLGEGSQQENQDDSVEDILDALSQATTLPESPPSMNRTVGERGSSRDTGLPTPPPDVVVPPPSQIREHRVSPAARRRRADTISSMLKEPNFQHVVTYLGNRFPDIENRIGSQLRGPLSRDPPSLFKERTQAYMDVCEGLNMPKMRPSDKYLAVNHEAGWAAEITCRHVAAWFSSFPRAKELERATLVNHRGVLIRWDRLWTDKEGLYHRRKYLLGTVDAEGELARQMAAVRLLGVVGYLFTTDSNKRQALVPPDVEDGYLKKPATSSWSWGEIEEGIELYFPEYAAKTRRRTAGLGRAMNDSVSE